jgi:hypothetical protein
VTARINAFTKISITVERNAYPSGHSGHIKTKGPVRNSIRKCLI